MSRRRSPPQPQSPTPTEALNQQQLDNRLNPTADLPATPAPAALEAAPTGGVLAGFVNGINPGANVVQGFVGLGAMLGIPAMQRVRTAINHEIACLAAESGAGFEVGAAVGRTAAGAVQIGVTGGLGVLGYARQGLSTIVDLSDAIKAENGFDHLQAQQLRRSPECQAVYTRRDAAFAQTLPGHSP